METMVAGECVANALHIMPAPTGNVSAFRTVPTRNVEMTTAEAIVEDVMAAVKSV